jgi:hypothetical protein
MEFFTSKTTCLIAYSKLCLLLLVFGILACNREDTLPFSVIPEIKLVSISHDTIVEYQDVLTITIEYNDGDGDLGFVDPDMNTIFVRDARLENFDGFYMGPVAPPEVKIPIQGKVNIEYPSLFLFGTRDTETTRFFIKIIDRAGHESNLIETPPVIIKKQP